MATGDNLRKSFLIVGVGASAGGLDAFQRFLSALPENFGFALVFIQHLSSKHKSLLAELLSARRPSLVIQQISDGLKIQPGRLYLAPPGREVRLQNGIFQTAVHPEGLIHLPIDEFFSSLAEDAAERSIALIFSGAGTDGSRGCQAVRSVGGTVFIQDPETAEFNSMPLAAIATGRADAVLAPEDIATELLKIQGIAGAAVGREYTITAEEYDDFFRILQEKIGARFTHYKKSVVSRRIRRRMYLHGFTTIKAYLDLVSADDSEAALLASDLMIGVTSFFRDRLAWRVLNAEAVRKIAAENTSLPIRVWTPATATGEEAYSIAMMLLQELALAGKKRDLHVFATDVNDRALERAREGRYPASITADMPQEYIQKFFTSSDNGNVLVINKDVRECVVFARQDLLSDPPFSKLDLIICRNFLIYLEPEAQEKCMTLFHYALNNGGYLFLGNAETVGRKSAFFKRIGRKQCRIYRKLETKPASSLPISVPYVSERPAAQTPKQAQLAELKKSVTEVIQEKLLEEYAPASVAVNQNYEIIYHNGPTNRYLRQPRGVPTQNLLELVPENLRSRIRSALNQSGREERPVVIRTSMAGDDNRKRQVSLRITKAAENLSIIVFHEKGAASTEEAAEAVDSANIEETAIYQLEGELSATRADLQSHIEQLKSMNEELQSSNEEMQAANEELETSREELQSLNEELITVNAQVQDKIEEQDATNNDLNNFLASTNIPTIFLDTHFSVKRFTLAMLRLIKLLPSDVGRPIVDMSQENLGSDLISDARSVLENLLPARRELEIGGVWYVRTTLPYRTADNRIEGVVITYNDVSELKKSEERTRHLASFPELNPNPVCEVHSSGKVTFCNPATEKVLVNLGMGIEDLTAFLPEDIDDILRDLEKKEETSLYRERVIRDRVFGMTVHLAPQFNVVRIYAYDITERKRAEEALRESEERLKLAHQAANIGAFEWNVQTGVNVWTPQLEAMYGLARGEFGKTQPAWEQLLHPEDRAAAMSLVNKTFETGEPVEGEWRVVWRNGSVHWIAGRFQAFNDATGRPLRLSGVNMDITERKKAEEALRESERRLKRSQEIAHLGSWELDLLNNVLTWSDEVYRIFGLQPQEFGATYEAFLERVHPDDRSAVDAAYSGSVRDGKDSYEVEHRVVRKMTGEVRFVHERCQHFRDESGRIIRSIGMVHDITERKQADEALRESEEQFRTLADSIPNLAWWANADGYITWYNRRWYEYTGTTPEQMEGWGWQSVHDPEVLPAVLERWKASIAAGTPFDMEFPLRGADGVFRTFLTRVEPLKDSAGQVLRWFGTNTDVSAMKQAEEALRESEEKYRNIIETASEGIWIGDFDGRTTFVNESAAKMIGYSPEELIGKTALDFMDEEAGATARLNLEQRRQGNKNNYELKFIRKDGSPLWAIVGAMPLRDKNGSVVASMAMLTDITGRKLAEEKTLNQQAVLTGINRIFREALATDSEEELGRVCLLIAEDLTGSKFGFIGEIGPDGLIHATAISDSGWDLCTMKDKTARHKPVGAFKVHGLFGRVIIDERPFFTNDPYLHHNSIGTPEGHPRLSAFLGVPLIHRGKTIGLIALGNREGGYRTEDVETMEPLATVIVQALMRKRTESSLQAAHAELKQRSYELEAVNRDLEIYSYTVSHDLKAPLRSVDGFARALLEDYADKLDPTAKDYLMRIHSATLRMDQLIQAMLDMARLTRRELNEQSVDLSALAQAIADNLRKQDPARTVEFNIADNIRVRGDNTLLQVVLENLMHNAWKFTGKNKAARIEFDVTMMHGHSVYFVKDNGAGFDMQFADKLFLPFKRLHLDSEFPGLGIGLATAYRIILRHNGRLWAESTLEKGATFYFTLP
jgi:two-component system, chemotaxis family, CheB/CheR fusion protein